MTDTVLVRAAKKVDGERLAGTRVGRHSPESGGDGHDGAEHGWEQLAVIWVTGDENQRTRVLREARARIHVNRVSTACPSSEHRPEHILTWRCSRSRAAISSSRLALKDERLQSRRCDPFLAQRTDRLCESGRLECFVRQKVRCPPAACRRGERELTELPRSASARDTELEGCLTTSFFGSGDESTHARSAHSGGGFDGKDEREEGQCPANQKGRRGMFLVSHNMFACYGM